MVMALQHGSAWKRMVEIIKQDILPQGSYIKNRFKWRGGVHFSHKNKGSIR